MTFPKTKIILLNPAIDVNKDLPNLALAYTATILNTEVLDLNSKPKPRERFLKKEAEVLGISIQSRALKEAEKIREEYQKKYPNSKVKSVETSIDIQCCYPFLELEEKIIIQEEFSDNLPFPNYELFDSFEIFQKNWQQGKWAFPLLTSLGCPYQCFYCQARDRKFRARSPENCFQELIRAREKWKIKSFQIIDDCFSLDKKRALEFCRLIESLKMNWFCINGLRADLFDEELAQAMAKAGCREMSFGVETTDPELLKNIKKGETIEKIEEAVKIAKNYFQEINLYFIIGLPFSSYQKDLKSFHWALNQRIKAHFSYYISEAGNSFYGKRAKPQSNNYEKRLQKRLYLMSGYMRGGTDLFGVLKNILKSFIFILFFDTKNIFSHFCNFLLVLFFRIKNRFYANLPFK